MTGPKFRSKLAREQELRFLMLFKRAKPTKRQDTRQMPSEPSYVARDTSFEGNISSDGEIHIDGEVRGSIRAHTCLVDKHGEVHGGISAQYVVVRGRVHGPITASQVTIQGGAHVEGNVINENIVIENGAYVMGSITRSNVIEQHVGKDRFFSPSFDGPNGGARLSEAEDTDKILPLKLVK